MSLFRADLRSFPMRAVKTRFLMLVVFIACVLPGLGACGFQPLHGQAETQLSGQAGGFSDVAIANIPERNGQYLRNQLVDKIYTNGYPSNPRYVLALVNLTEQSVSLGIRKDATATRAQMRMTARLQLKDMQKDEIVLTRDLVATNSYNILNSQYTTNVSTRYARERVLDDIADQTFTQLALYFKRDD